MKHLLFRLALVAPSLLACDRICGDDANTNIAGDWSITAEAECENQEGIDSEILVESQLTLPVVQTGGGQTLALGSQVSSAGSTLSFAGSVNGSCVDFTVTERGEDYELSYRFEGVVDGNRITGEISGRGEGVCPLRGDFQATIYSNGRPASTDGGVVGVDGSVTSTTVERECYRNSECAAGICQAGTCVIICDEAADCATGQKCISGRCEIARGCNCRATGPSETTQLSGLLLVFCRFVLRRLRRR